MASYKLTQDSVLLLGAGILTIGFQVLAISVIISADAAVITECGISGIR